MQKSMDWRTVSFDWNQARAFLVTAEEGSFSAAARALGVAQPTIGRQVAALESALGLQLLERVGRGVALTPAGLELIEQVRGMGDAATRVSLSAAGQSMSLDGVVCITASEAISAWLLPPIVARVRALHPGIEVELVATNEVRDLRRREADIAVRNTRPTDPELVATRVRGSYARAYATPEYLARIGSDGTLDGLARAEFFGFDRTDLMISGFAQLGLHLSARSFPIVSSNHLVQWELAKQGLGVCMMMEEVGDAEPRVVRACELLPPIPVPIWIASRRELWTSRRMRVVFDLLKAGLGSGCAQP